MHLRCRRKEVARSHMVIDTDHSPKILLKLFLQQPERHRYALKLNRDLTQAICSAVQHPTFTTISPTRDQIRPQADPSHPDHQSEWPFLGVSSVAARHSTADVR